MHAHLKLSALALLGTLLAAGLSAEESLAQVRMEAEAVAGEPFGAGRLIIQASPDMLPQVLGVDGLVLTERNGRVLYPTIEEAPLGGLFGDLLGRPQRITVRFLFTGDDPLKLDLQARARHSGTVRITSDAVTYGRLLRGWWRGYSARPRLFKKRPDYPPLVEDYLTPMLARRLNLALPERRRQKSWQRQIQRELGVTLGTEEIRAAMLRDRMLGRAALKEAADQPLPAPIRPPEMVVPPLPEEVEVEPIAMRVPEECLYIRFVSVSNFLWFRDTLERWKGDLRNLVVHRGLDYEPVKRMERQLSLRQSELVKLLGGAVIGMLGNAVVADVALIGTDQFQREGAALGILFKARNNTLLATEILRQRAEAVKSQEDVAEQKVTVAGRKVSLVCSADNRVRAFYVADGDYHLVTNSQTLVQRFLETRDGSGALGASKDFRYARTLMPANRKDTAFIYLSDAFFRNLVSPQYRIEMIRRLQATADCDLVQLAVLAAATEGKPGGTLQRLVAGGLLPPEFGPRPDGSRTVLDGGRVSDSLRGRRGSFLPVPDAKVTAVSRSETRAYEEFREHYRAKWGRVDPLMVAVKREALKENRERVVLDIRVTPLAKLNYDRLTRWFGPPAKTRLAAVPGDLAAGELVMLDERVFIGLRNAESSGAIINELVPVVGIPPFLPLYVGTIGKMGLLGLLNAAVPFPPDENGYAGIEGGLWRRQWGPFTAFSFQSRILTDVTPQLRLEDAARPAQVRLRIDDLSQARLTPLLNALGYTRTRKTSLGNVRLLHALEQQLRVPGKDCKEAAELLLDAKLSCPLGGKYEYREAADGVQRWTSSALGAADGQMPEDFQTPPLNWFRGLKGDAILTPEAISAHAQIEMKLPEDE